MDTGTVKRNKIICCITAFLFLDFLGCSRFFGLECSLIYTLVYIKEHSKLLLARNVRIKSACGSREDLNRANYRDYHSRGIICEESWMRTHGRDIIEEKCTGMSYNDWPALDWTRLDRTGLHWMLPLTVKTVLV